MSDTYAVIVFRETGAGTNIADPASFKTKTKDGELRLYYSHPGYPEVSSIPVDDILSISFVTGN